ncbi:T9SS type A sorting domain-containing protein [bacterium]|nr:T9SS type A sorting domain-containing protein [bacterium]
MKKLLFVFAVLVLFFTNAFGIIINFYTEYPGPPMILNIEVFHDGEPDVPITDFHFAIVPASCQIVSAEPPPGWELRYGLPSSFVEMDASNPDAAIPPGGMAVFGLVIDGEGCEEATYEFWLTGPEGVIPGTQRTGPLGGLGIDEKPTPESFFMKAYPNPFNSSIEIAVVGIPNATPVSIGIYDLGGRLISMTGKDACLIKQNHSSGFLSPNSCSLSFSWQPDESVGSGIYLIRATSGERSILKRVIYLK